MSRLSSFPHAEKHEHIPKKILLLHHAAHKNNSSRESDRNEPSYTMIDQKLREIFEKKGKGGGSSFIQATKHEQV
jgi:hypothetical protein